MSAITTHVLDTTLGRPAPGIPVLLEHHTESGWFTVAKSITDTDGRCRNLGDSQAADIYRLTFDVAAYFAGQGRKSIYRDIVLTFATAGDEHYHLPLLLSDNSYTTYRGS